jgi:hypothetical protein
VRIDGSGGDGGRDVELVGDVKTFWEIKGFPDQLSRSTTRRKQIIDPLSVA